MYLNEICCDDVHLLNDSLGLETVFFDSSLIVWEVWFWWGFFPSAMEVEFL